MAALPQVPTSSFISFFSFYPNAPSAAAIPVADSVSESEFYRLPEGGASALTLASRSGAIASGSAGDEWGGVKAATGVATQLVACDTSEAALVRRLMILAAR